MKKRISIVLASLLALALALAGCSGASGTEPSAGASDTPSSSQAIASSSEPAEKPTVHIAGLKGATTIGMLRMLEQAKAGEGEVDYDFAMYGTPDEIVPKLVQGELDAAAIPANLASVLYNNPGADVQVVAINTLGVLYVVETGESIQSVEDLRGKTVYSTGKGTTPELAFNYILRQNGLDPETDLTVEYKSESTEVAAILAEANDAVAVLPQPYVSAVQMQNERVRMALDLSAEWDVVSTGADGVPESSMVTGVLVVRTAFAEENPDTMAAMLAEYEASIDWAIANPEQAAPLVVEYGIVEKEPVAQRALPYINIAYIAGDEMETALGGYLEALFEQNPQFVGGALPGEDFYYKG